MCVHVYISPNLLVSLKQVDRGLADSNTSNSCKFLKIGGSVKQTGPITAHLMKSLKAVLFVTCLRKAMSSALRCKFIKNRLP